MTKGPALVIVLSTTSSDMMMMSMIWSQQDCLASCIRVESALSRQEKHVAEDFRRKSLLGVMFRSHLGSPFSPQTDRALCLFIQIAPQSSRISFETSFPFRWFHGRRHKSAFRVRKRRSAESNQRLLVKGRQSLSAGNIRVCVSFVRQSYVAMSSQDGRCLYSKKQSRT